MVFADLFFLYLFLPVCLIFYFIKKDILYRNVILIVFSLIFYAWGEPVWIVLLLFSTVINYYFGKMIGRYNGRRAAKLVTALSVLLNLALLGTFKYTGFLVSNINTLFSASFPVPQFALPLGISFYTFKAISYTVDCCWEKVEPEQSFSRFLLFMTLFPQVTQGPIVRYSIIGEELAVRNTKMEDIRIGIGRIITGLAKKVILADTIGNVVSDFFSQGISGLSVAGTWYGAFMFALQIYFDFSGYSDMAVGLGRIFGFHFNENFNYPFICKSITEFWQRWHISLSTFFRDYVLYLPIFGKRRQYLNLFLVWFCTGLWHGANYNYIIWGLYFGVFILIERLITKKRMNRAPKLLLHIYTKLVLVIGFGIFYFEDFGELGHFFKNIIGISGNPLIDEVTKNSFMNHIYLIAAAIVVCIPVIPWLKNRIAHSRPLLLAGQTAELVCHVALLLICSIMLVNATNHPFLYVQW